MSIYDSGLWISDLDEVLETLPELSELEGKSVMITGATGLICSAVTDVLIRRNMTRDNKIRILAAGRSKEKAEARFAPFMNEEWFKFVPYDAASAGNELKYSCDYIIHGASNASPNKIIKEPVETMMSNLMGTKLLLDHARSVGAKRFLLISSSEVYGRKDHDRPYGIDEHGWIDILNPRSSYSVGKCAAETMCASYADEYGVETVIIRPGHIYGPTADVTDNRVSSAWAYAAARGEDIVMKSDGAQIRSYCYCLDCACAILKVLLCGENVHAYNISNPDSVISIRILAEMLARSAGVQLKMECPSDEEKKAFNPMSNSSLDSSQLRKLGWRSLFDAERGIRHTIGILKDEYY